MARPVYLYLIQRGALSWRKAASGRNVTALSTTWTASSISHTEPEMSGEAERDAVKITLPLSDDFANEQVRDRPEGTVTVTIYEYERSDDTYQIEWSGRMTTCKADGGEVTLQCEPATAGLTRANRSRIYMRQCPHAVYYGECRLNRADFARTAGLISVSGNVVSIEASTDAPDGTYTGGIIEAGNGDTRTIKNHADGLLYLTRPLPALLDDLAASEPVVTLYPGCARTLTACASFANADNPSGTNIENYGGFPGMLTGEVNPFAGSSVL